MKFLIAALAAGAVLGAAFVADPAASAAARTAISFTAAQASTGQATYYANCAKCHGANLEGISGPALKGKDGNLQEQTVSGVYTYTITQMPVGNAGGLPSTDYVNIMAFLLRANGRRPGQAKLTVASLKADTSKVGGPK